MSAKLQVKLLRVLQENEFERVGESRPSAWIPGWWRRRISLLEDEIEAGRFRDDLYYRLNVVPINLPPLRERREDIPPLARYFLETQRKNRRDPPEFDGDAGSMLQGPRLAGQRPRAGNYIERAVVLSDGQPLTPDMLAPPAKGRRAGSRKSEAATCKR